MRLGRKRREEQRASLALYEIRRDLRALDVEWRRSIGEMTKRVVEWPTASYEPLVRPPGRE